MMLGALFGVLTTKMRRALALVGAVLVAIGAAWLAGYRAARDAARARAERRRADDAEEIARAIAEAGDNPQGAREWLDEFSKGGEKER